MFDLKQINWAVKDIFTDRKGMFSQVSVILSTIGIMAIQSLLILITAWSVRILLECFLVQFIFTIKDVKKGSWKVTDVQLSY